MPHVNNFKYVPNQYNMLPLKPIKHTVVLLQTEIVGKNSNLDSQNNLTRCRSNEGVKSANIVKDSKQ